MNGGAPTATRLGETARMAVLLADRMARQVVADLPFCVQGAHTWRDVRPLLCEHEYSPATRDMHAQVLQYLHLRGLIAHHAGNWHLVRFTTATEEG